MISIIDIGISNINSVVRAFERLKIQHLRVVRSSRDLSDSAAIVLPGVGAFGDGMRGLREAQFIEPILEHVKVKHRPIFGICLGMQMLATCSDEFGTHEGLDLIQGHVRQLSPQHPSYRVPNMGWCDTELSIPWYARSNSTFYYAHSFYIDCQSNENVVGTIEYDGKKVTAAIFQDVVFGVQFHPEKSQSDGLQLMDAFFRHFDLYSR